MGTSYADVESDKAPMVKPDVRHAKLRRYSDGAAYVPLVLVV